MNEVDQMTKDDKTNPVRRILEEVWNQKQLNLLPDLCHSNMRFHLSEGYIEGRDRLRDEVIIPTMEAFPDIYHTIDELITEGDRIAMKYTGSGTHENDFDGKQATGNRLEYKGVTIFHLKDVKVDEVWNYSNWSEMFAAL